jgi:hypothetical protein
VLSPMHKLDSAVAEVAANGTPVSLRGWGKVGAAVNTTAERAMDLVQGAEQVLNLSQFSEPGGRAARAALDPTGSGSDLDPDFEAPEEPDDDDSDSSFWADETGSDWDDGDDSSGSDSDSDLGDLGGGAGGPRTPRSTRSGVAAQKSTAAPSKSSHKDMLSLDAPSPKAWIIIADTVYFRADMTSQAVRYSDTNPAGSRVASNQGAEAMNWSSSSKIPYVDVMSLYIGFTCQVTSATGCAHRHILRYPALKALKVETATEMIAIMINVAFKHDQERQERERKATSAISALKLKHKNSLRPPPYHELLTRAMFHLPAVAQTKHVYTMLDQELHWYWTNGLAALVKVRQGHALITDSNGHQVEAVHSGSCTTPWLGSVMLFALVVASVLCMM